MLQPYNSLNNHLRTKYGEKVYKLALDGGMTCPNRDGTIGTGGCIFCSAGGSGDFAERINSPYGLDAAKARLAAKATGTKYIAYFQSFTNTYAPVAYLRELFEPLLDMDDIVGISIGTRPDCLPGDVLDLLSELNRQKPITVELGLQTIHETTALQIRRGYPLSCFEMAVKALRQRNLEVVVHLILGLPSEGKAEMLQSVRYLNTVDIQGVKLQLLHVLSGTDLATIFASEALREQHRLHILTQEEYIDIVCDAIGQLSPDIVIHRLTGDGPKRLLLAPLWSGDKKRVLNALHKELARRRITQGCQM